MAGATKVTHDRMTAEERKACNNLKAKQRNKRPLYSSYVELWAAWRDKYVTAYANSPEDLARVREIYADMAARPHANDAFDLSPSKAGGGLAPASGGSGSPVDSPVREVVSPAREVHCSPVTEEPVASPVLDTASPEPVVVSATVALEERVAALEALLAERDSVVAALQGEVAALRDELGDLREQLHVLDDAATDLRGDVEHEREQKRLFVEHIVAVFGGRS